MESSRRDLYFEGDQTRVVGGLAELGSGGRKRTADNVWTRNPPPFCKITKKELMAPSIMRKESVVEGDEVRWKRGRSKGEEGGRKGEDGRRKGGEG